MGRSAKTVYVCSACGGQSPKWAGQCADCGAWNTLEEARQAVTKGARASDRYASYAGQDGAAIQSLSEIVVTETERYATGLMELDRVLGGGLVRGSVVLLGGDPGIGKSTLLTQVLGRLGASLPVLYVSGEESAEQIGLRTRRLGLAQNLRLLTETNVERILALAHAERPRVMVMDSIQTFYSEQFQSAPGSVAQVRESAAQLVKYAKLTGTSLFLVGHVTKEGALAGPRVLEHMVDTVLYFEGEAGSRFRLVRAVKNRFGAVNELGVFAMTDKGLKQVDNPSALFLSRHQSDVPGSAILITREGTRPLLVEVQALVDQSALTNPRRVALGLDQGRLSMLLAVLHRHGGVAMFDQDVFLNVVGGVRVTETASDLVVLLAVLSSFRDHPVPRGLAAFGEVGLAGEVRPVPNGPERLKEALKHGCNRVIVPAANAPKQPWDDLEIAPVARLAEVLDMLF